MVFQWFSMVANHWSDDGMVTIHRSGLIRTAHTPMPDILLWYRVNKKKVSSVSLYNRMLDSGKIFCPLPLSAQPVFWDRASNLQMDRPGFFTHQARSGDRGIVRHLTELSPENVTCTRAHSTMRTILEPNLRSVWATVTSCWATDSSGECWVRSSAALRVPWIVATLSSYDWCLCPTKKIQWDSFIEIFKEICLSFLAHQDGPNRSVISRSLAPDP